LSPRRPSRVPGDADISASSTRELAATLVRAQAALPSNLESAVIDALAELLELAATLRELPLENVNPMLWPTAGSERGTRPAV
jgi:hypothetical protein